MARISRFERITNLVLALLNSTRPISLREIGTAVAGYPREPGALRQAFERDKRTLRDGGIPIAVERIDGDEQVGYRILPEDYYLPDLGLSAAEEEALAFALTAVRLEGSLSGALAARFGASGTEASAPVAVLPELPQLAELHESLRSRHPVRFSYHDRPRLIEGYGLAFRRGAWYLVGNERSSDGTAMVKTFRVDRIEDSPVSDLTASYEVPAGFEAGRELRLAPFATGDAAEDSVVVVAVDVREAHQLTRVVGEDAVTARREDTVELTFRVGDEEALLSYLLSFGDAVELLEPPALRARMAAALTAASRRA